MGSLSDVRRKQEGAIIKDANNAKSRFFQSKDIVANIGKPVKLARARDQAAENKFAKQDVFRRMPR